MEENIILKINKLLALQSSTNDNEAQTALLMANKLMMKYKLTFEDLKLYNTEFVEYRTSVFYHTRLNIWVEDLAEIIATNCCCIFYSSKSVGKQSLCVIFKGYKNDIEFCVRLFNYAYEYLINRLDAFKKECKANNKNISAKEIRKITDNYGIGFTKGLNEMFIEQGRREKVENGGNWLEVTKVPNVLIKELQNIPEWNACTIEHDEKHYNNGLNDGLGFTFNRKLNE